MEGLLQPPAATAFDAVASIVCLVVYLGAALGMLARRPGESHPRVFLVVALTSAIPFSLSALQWWKGSGVYTPASIAFTAAAFCIGSAALFHFTQVFPWRRPWIRAHGWWLIAAYAVPVIPMAAMTWVLGSVMSELGVDTGSGGLGAVSAGLPEAFILLGGLPAVLLVGIVLPVAGVLSLVKSWREARAASNEPARVTTFWILISQLAGGVLAILVLPLLHFAGVPLIWSTIFAALAYAFALVMPISYVLTGALNTDAGVNSQRLNSTTPNVRR